MKPTLISFNICPFVQRSVITLIHKKVDFDIKYIDLENKPDWFLQISPLGKVPVLQIGNAVLFESAVINEYLDEVNPPSIHPVDPLQKAQHRAWIEFISTLLMNQYKYSIASDLNEAQKHIKSIQTKMQRLENHITGPYFHDDQFRLIDAAIAPFFMRQTILDSITGIQSISSELPKIQKWSQVLLSLPAVQKSVVSEFDELFKAYIHKSNFYALA